MAGVQEEIFLWAKQEAFTPQAHDVSGVIIKQLGKKFICGQPDGNKVAHLLRSDFSDLLAV